MICSKILLERIKIFCCEKLGWNSAAQPYVPSTIRDTHDTIWNKHKLWGTWHGSFDCRKLGVLAFTAEFGKLLPALPQQWVWSCEIASSDEDLRGCQAHCCRARSWITELKSSGLPDSLLQRQETKAVRFAFPQLITIILHSVLEHPHYSQFRLFPLAEQYEKVHWVTQWLWVWLLTVSLAWESTTDGQVVFLGLLGSQLHVRSHYRVKNLSWKGRWA